MHIQTPEPGVAPHKFAASTTLLVFDCRCLTIKILKQVPTNANSAKRC